MWFDSAFDAFDCLKSSVPFSVVFILPFLMIISPVNGAQNFPVYRMNQFDFAGNTYGSRSTLVNMEARSISSTGLARKCVVAKLNEVTLSLYRHLVDQNIGALVILLPGHLDNLTVDEREQFMGIEKLVLLEETLIPVYFVIEDDEILEIYNRIKSSTASEKTPTATEALLQAISANGFQMNIHTPSSKKQDKYKTINLHGVLEGSGNADRLPTVLLVAHYDAMSGIPGLSYGADSNGSGAVALLELMRIFQRLFSSSNKPEYNIAFLLSGSAKLNYFGTKKWLEEMRESSKFPYLNQVESVICLDSIASQSSNLYIHISKPPKEGSANHQLIQHLKEAATEFGSSAEHIHKKIALAHSKLAWEHEQFAMSKMAGMTISSLENHKAPIRTSALDTRSSVTSQVLTQNIHVIGEAVARYIFSLSSNDSAKQVTVLDADLAVQRSMVKAWLDLLTSEPRAAQLLKPTSSLLISMEQAFQRYLQSVSRTTYTCDTRDPEFVLYDPVLDTMHVYSVKPAVFDLFLAVVIGAYLGVVYLLSLAYPSLASKIMNKTKKA